MKNGENFKLLYDLADKIGAAGKSSLISYSCILHQTHAATCTMCMYHITFIGERSEPT